MGVSKKVEFEKYKTTLQRIGILLFIYFQYLPLLIVGQSSIVPNSIITLIDSNQKIYGANDLLVNGHVYYQPNRMASGTPFIFSQKFTQGIIFTGGVSFEVTGLNYNIVDQEIILLNITDNGSKLHIKLSNMLIDSFLLNKYIFINPEELCITSNYPYMLLTNKGKYYLLIGYDKEFINRFSQNDPYGKFSSTKKSIFLAHDNTSVSINSKKAFYRSFPSIKKEISTFLKKHNIKLLKASPEQLKQLMDFCNNETAKADE